MTTSAIISSIPQEAENNFFYNLEMDPFYPPHNPYYPPIVNGYFHFPKYWNIKQNNNKISVTFMTLHPSFVVWYDMDPTHPRHGNLQCNLVVLRKGQLAFDFFTLLSTKSQVLSIN